MITILPQDINFYKKSKKPYSRKHGSNIHDIVPELFTQPHSTQTRLINQTAASTFFISNYLLVLVIVLFYLIKSAEYQLIKGKYYKKKAAENTLMTYMIPAERGVIYDRKNVILVRNKPAFSLVMDTKDCLVTHKNLCMATLTRIQTYLPINVDAVLTEIKAQRQNVVLAEGLTKDQVLVLESKLGDIPDVEIVTAPIRDYLLGQAGAHVLGYVSQGETLFPSIEGKMGIEQFYNASLSGLSGKKSFQTEASGKRIGDALTQNPIAGKSITVYLDRDFQLYAYNQLKQAVVEKKATGGAIVAQVPTTGEVLALVSYPAFDPDKFTMGISAKDYSDLINDASYPFFNRAISGVYPPGSTFKLITALAALEEQIITPKQTLYDPGYISVNGYTFKTWKEGGHGDVDLLKAIQVSNDTYFYIIGGGYEHTKGLGIEKLSKWGKLFGIGKKTGIDLYGEAAGYMPDGTTRAWYLGDNFITSIGQGDVLATPLQTNTLLNFFANGGYLVKPKILKAIQGEPEKPVSLLADIKFDRKNYQTIREGLRLALAPGGTGYPVFDVKDKYGFYAAGKTGTSEYINSKGEKATHAWFTVFAPYDNPSISVTVFLEGGGSGADDAGPVARSLMDYWFSHSL